MLHDVMAHARLTIPGVASGEKPVSVVMTHDWGICIAFAWYVLFVRMPCLLRYTYCIGRSGRPGTNIAYIPTRSSIIP